MSIKHTNGFVKYELTREDLALLDEFYLIHGEAHLTETVLNHRLCVMQAVSLVTTEQDRDLELEARYLELTDEERAEHRRIVSAVRLGPLSDDPICVSEAVTDAMITLNDDNTITSDQRQQLKDLIPLVVGTCPIKRDPEGFEYRDRNSQYHVLESRRWQILRPILNLDEFATFEEKVAALREAATLTL